jgi:hypothetical protein
MARIATIVRWQWIAYWRRIKRGGQLNAGNQGIVFLLACVVLFKYAQLLRVASVELARGRTPAFEGLLLGIFVALMYPVAGNALLAPTQRFLHLPLTLRELLGIRVLSLLIPIYPWMIVAATVALFYPLLAAPHPFAAALATALFIVFSGCLGLTVSHLTLLSRGRKLLLLLLLLLSLSAGPLLLFSKNRPERIAFILSMSPTRMVANTAVASGTWRTLLITAALALLSFWLAGWSFRWSLAAGPPSYSQAAPIFGALKFPGRFGELVTKDLRHFRRMLDLYFGLLIAGLCGSYLIIGEDPGLELFWPFLILFFTLNANLAFNFFGFDKPPAFDRYKLLPASGRMIILSKNLMFVIITGVQILVLLVLTTWRLGWFVTALTTIEVAVLMLGFMTWGNWLSVRYPVKLQFYRIASGGPLVEIILALCLANLPAVGGLYLLLSNQTGIVWKMGLIMLLVSALYLVSISWSGKYFERTSDKIRNQLA